MSLKPAGIATSPVLIRVVFGDPVASERLALYLASPAGRNVSGQAISVDGNVEYP